jgi:hypothetical protein
VTDFPLPLEGGCFCGQVRYRITQPPRFAMACHCTDCQQMTASAFSLGLVVPREGLALTGAEPRGVAKVADSGGFSTRYVCPACATWTHTEPAMRRKCRWYARVRSTIVRGSARWRRSSPDPRIPGH